MPNISKKHLSVLGGALIGLLLLLGCASIGNPSGGPRDENPPRFVRANPTPGSVNVDPGNIYIDFNELVNVKDAFQNVVLSPPGESTPRVSTRGRRVVVNITDTLLPNTTYTIDFGDAIEDNNEGNKLSGFAYTFSTGPTLDSLRIGGMVLGAEDMEPQQGVFVGAYISKEDSAFIRKPFERLARTDEYGRFIIRGLQDTTYRLFALRDLDNDKHYANPEEDIAWFEDVIRPSAERITVTDTIRNLYDGAIDTLIQRERTRFLPNNVLLRMFNTGLKPQYLVSYTRPDSTQLVFIFNSPTEKQPRIMIADDEVYSSPLKAERSIGNDTLTFWLPKELASRDTLKIALQYHGKELMTGIETIINDTVKLMKPKPAAAKKKKDKKKKESKIEKIDSVPDIIADSLGLKTGSDSIAASVAVPVKKFSFTAKGPDAYTMQPLSIEAPIPIATLDSSAFHLEMRPDTIWMPAKQKYKIERADTLSERRFKIQYPWERGMTYRLTIDSLSAQDIYGIENDLLEYEFKTKATEDLSTLKIKVNGLEDGMPAFIELIVSGDKPKYSAPVKDGIAFFDGIEAGKYYARLYEDFDGNGKFTTGSYRMQKVFGERTDTLIAAEDTVITRIDSLKIDTNPLSLRSDTLYTDVDSLSANLSDSTGIITADTVALQRGFVMPKSDKEIVDSLKSIGYSLIPIVSDSIGKDILIAIQPDYVYYYPKIINVKKNWDIEQEWNVFDTPLDLQKPTKIKKNKPKNNKNRQEREEEEEDEDDEIGTNPFMPSNNRNRNSANRNLR
ncbi:MAG: Ig-like domain-containing protein [Muribaculaceae bacterium]|nr:Ig-like domain-containing protein [Muribaculaceae bacterium]